MSTSRPTTKQTFVDPVLNLANDPTPVINGLDTVDEIEDELGLPGDARSSVGGVHAKVKDLYARLKAQTTAPTSPQTNDLWLDTSGTTPVLKRYTGAAWVMVSGEARTADGGTFNIATAGGLLDVADAWQMVVTGAAEVTQINQPADPASFIRPVMLIFDTAGYGIAWDASNVNLQGPFRARYGSENITIQYDGNAGVWRETGRNERTGMPELAVVAADQARTSTTLSNVTGLAIPLDVGAYRYEAHLMVTAATAGGQKYGLAFGGGTVSSLRGSIIIGDLSTAGATPFRMTALSGTVGRAGDADTEFDVTYRGYLSTTAAGTITIQAAQFSAAGTTTIRQGSALQTWPVP